MAAESSPPTLRRGRKSSRPLKRLLVWGAAGTLVLAVSGIFAGQIWLENHLKSEAFRLQLSKAIGRALRADTHISLPQRSGTSLYIDSLDASGAPEGQSQPARFRELHAYSARAELDLSALWRRVWRVESIAIQRAQCDLTPEAAAPAPGAPGEPAARLRPTLLARLLPNRSEIAGIRVERADIRRGSNHVKQVRIHAQPSGTEGDWALSAEGGELTLGAFPELAALQIQSARLFLKRGSTVLRDAKLLARSGGQCALSGEWKETGSELRGRLEGVPIHPFLPSWWQSRLLGAVDGEILVRQSPNAAPEIEATLSMKNGKLEALPFLSELDLFLKSPRFRSVPLRSASAKVLHSTGGTELRGLKMDADGLLRVEGDLLIRDGQMDGTLQVGISASLVQWLPIARSKVFSENREGYVWTPVRISGTPMQPIEDLSKRLAAAAAGTVLDTVTEAINPQKKPGGSEEPKPADAKPANPLIAPVKNALDAVKSLLPGN